jgi:hypothetical protein
MTRRTKRHIVVIDWDGTLVENRWPQMGGWLPGAVDAIKRFQQEGYKVLIFSARLSPYWLDGSKRPAEAVATSVKEVRTMLDEAGLPTVGIWTKPGKPPFSKFIDDKAVAFPSTPTKHTWRRITEKVLVSLGAEDPLYEDVEWEGAPS